MGHLYLVEERKSKSMPFDFTKTEYEQICEECMLSEEFKTILEMKIRGYSRIQIADKLGMSIDALDKKVSKLKKKIKKVI